MVRLLAFALLTTVSVICPACSRAFVVAPGSDMRAVLSQHVAWSADRRLKWADYRAQPPAGPSGEGATSALSLVWGFQCNGSVLDFQVMATFYPQASWVEGALLVDADNGWSTLRHEQTHFDLVEVYARMMRRFFGSLNRPCDRSTEDLTALGQQFEQYQSEAQRQYDEESEHGRDKIVQSHWDEYVQHALEDLESFAPDVPPSTWPRPNSGLEAGSRREPGPKL